MREIVTLRKGAFVLFAAATAMVGCSKSDSNSNPTPPTPPVPQAKVETPTHLKGWAIQPKVDTQQPYMVFSTEKEGEQALMLTLAEGKDNKVWIDTNNNGILDKEDVKVTDPTKSMALASKPNVYAVYSKAVRVVASGNALAKAITFTPKQKVYAVYGKVASVVASGNALTAADVRANPALTELNVANNKLSEAALTSLVQHLPTPGNGETAAVVLRNKDLGTKEGNVVNATVLAEVKKKGWAPQAIQDKETVADQEGAKPEPKNPEDYYIELTTEKAIGEKVKLYINAAKEDQPGVWIDLNSNGQWDEGIDQKPEVFGNIIRCSFQTQIFRIYGKVSSLDCEDNELSAIDISHNDVLTKLLAKKNKLSSITHLEHLTTISLDTHTLQSSNLPDGLISLDINETSPLPTIDTKPFTKLKFLSIIDCKSIKSLDLSLNTDLSSLRAIQSGLTELDLSYQPYLSFLSASRTPFTKLNITGNKALGFVYIELTSEGEGLKGEALMQFIEQLPKKEAGKEGKIRLSPEQASEAVKELLQKKYWSFSIK